MSDDERQEFNSQQLADILDVVFRMGGLLAGAGAAAFRVRETMCRAAGALGLEDVDVIVSTDALHVTAQSGPQFRTRVQRVPAMGVDMRRIGELEMLSRRLLRERPTGPLPQALAAYHAELDALESVPQEYPLWITGPLLGASCAAFCGGMGGTGWQMTATFFGSYLGHLLRLYHVSKHPHPPVATIVVTCAFVSALFSFLVAKTLAWGAPQLVEGTISAAFEPAKAVLASVLYLIPGVPLVNSLIDLLHFDLNAGVSRGAFAVLVIVCIAVGVLAFWSVLGMASL